MIKVKLLYPLENLDEESSSVPLHEIVIDWHLPFLPRAGESFDLKAYVDFEDDIQFVLGWTVQHVAWERNDKESLYPALYLTNIRSYE